MATAARKKTAVIDGDGHILEPRDLWEKNLPSKFKDVAIKVVWDPETQLEDECVEGVAYVPKLATANGWARVPMEKRADPRGWRWEELTPAGLDPKARVEELDRDGIDQAVLYPSLGLLLGGIRDPEHAVAACRIYNDWLAEFCSVAPDRLIGIAAVPVQDPRAAPLEARRAVEELGMRGVYVRPNASEQYLPHNPALDPLWETVQGLGIPVGLHPAGQADTAGAAKFYQPLWGTQTRSIAKPMNFLVDDLMCLTMMIGTKVLDRFPELKVIVLECGGGWLPHWIDKMDHWVEVVPWRAPELKPSEYIHRQVWVSFDPDETTLPFVVDMVGDEGLIWASDFPHMDVIAPSATQELYGI